MTITQWAERSGVVVVAWHSDAGVSGAADLAHRPALGAAFNDLANWRAGALVVARRDRLARDVVVAASIERAAVQHGARVVSADGVGNGDTPADEFMRTILDGAAAYERALIRSRTRAALRARRAKGERAGNVPWGYNATLEGKLLAHEPERAVSTRVLALHQTGNTMRGIVKALGDEGLVSRTGQPLQLTQVARILSAHRKAS